VGGHPRVPNNAAVGRSAITGPGARAPCPAVQPWGWGAPPSRGPPDRRPGRVAFPRAERDRDLAMPTDRCHRETGSASRESSTFPVTGAGGTDKFATSGNGHLGRAMSQPHVAGDDEYGNDKFDIPIPPRPVHAHGEPG
jgi:hypothetical protein